MTEFESIPVKVSAIQFLGTTENALDVMNFILKRGIIIKRFQMTSYEPRGGTTCLSMNLDGEYVELHPFDWIAIHKDGKFERWPNSGFTTRFARYEHE